MADRATLHRTKLAAFSAWLESDGWTIAEPKGEWEVLRASKVIHDVRRWVFAYDRYGGDHYSVQDRDFRLVRRFIAASR